MAQNQNIRRAEGILRSVPVPGQIVCDPSVIPVRYPADSSPFLSALPLNTYNKSDFQITKGWRDKYFDYVGFALLQ